MNWRLLGKGNEPLVFKVYLDWLVFKDIWKLSGKTQKVDNKILTRSGQQMGAIDVIFLLDLISVVS